MKIRAVEIRHWTCIESLSIADLSDGVIILHGPNQTGKSSLVRALRSCLLDFDHDSGAREILSAIPRRSGEVPHVAVEIEIEAKRYRVEKAFTKKAGGFAKLFQQSSTGWDRVAEGKDANPRIRELIGVQKSTSGLYQLMWLEQGSVTLPDKLDPQLQKSLEGVLGSMITGRDLDFFRKLEKACERWFTPLMKDSKNSPISELFARIKEAETAKTKIDQDWQLAETTLKQYDEAIAQQPDLRTSLAVAEREFDAVAKEREAIAMRRSQHESAARHRDAEKRQLESAQQRLGDWMQALQRRKLTEQEMVEAEHACAAASERLREATETLSRSRSALEGEESEARNLLQVRAGIDDRIALVNHAIQTERIESNLASVRELRQRIAELEQKLREFPAVTQAEIDDLRKNRDRAITLRAQLEAAEIQIVIEAKQPLQGEMVRDTDAPADIAIPTGDSSRWLVRQKARFRLGDWANIQIGRVTENVDLEQSAMELGSLNQSFAAAIRAAGLDPDAADGIDQLVTRRTDSEAWTRELKKGRDSIGKTAPEGVPALEAKLDRLRDLSESIKNRRAELREWTPDSAEIERLQADLDRIEQETKRRHEEKREAVRQAERVVQMEQSAFQKLRDRVIELAADSRTISEVLAKNSEAELTEAVTKAQTRLADAEKIMLATTLTDEERRIESRYEAALSAREQRSRRLRENETTVVRLQAMLAGTEGLHQKRIQAEQTVNDLQRNCDRERLFADAHKHLKTLFEQVRQEQVRRTVGPINDRVMQWTRQLGVADYASLEFGDRLLPGGLNPKDPSGMVEFDKESFGTQEQLSILIRLAIGGLLARGKSMAAIFDDPLAHADALKHRRMLDIFTRAAKGEEHGPHPTGPLQLLVLTCHAERFDHLPDAQRIDMAQAIRRGM